MDTREGVWAQEANDKEEWRIIEKILELEMRER